MPVRRTSIPVPSTAPSMTLSSFRSEQGHDPHHDPQGVVPDIPGLDTAQGHARAADQHSRPVHRTVDDLVFDHGGGELGQACPGPADDGVEDLVEVPRMAEEGPLEFGSVGTGDPKTETDDKPYHLQPR